MTRVMLMIVRAKQGTKGLLHGIIHIYDNSVTQVYYSPFCKWGTKAQRSLMTCLKSPRKLGSVLGYHCSHSVCLRKFIHILWFPLLQKQTDDVSLNISANFRLYPTGKWTSPHAYGKDGKFKSRSSSTPQSFHYSWILCLVYVSTLSPRTKIIRFRGKKKTFFYKFVSNIAWCTCTLKKNIRCLSKMQTSLGVFLWSGSPSREHSSNRGNCLQPSFILIPTTSISSCWFHFLSVSPNASPICLHSHNCCPVQAPIISSVEDHFRTNPCSLHCCFLQTSIRSWFCRAFIEISSVALTPTAAVLNPECTAVTQLNTQTTTTHPGRSPTKSGPFVVGPEN